MAVLQLFNREDRSFDEFEAAKSCPHGGLQGFHLGIRPVLPAVELVGVIAVAIILYMGGGMALRGAVSVGTAIAFIQYSQRSSAHSRLEATSTTCCRLQWRARNAS